MNPTNPHSIASSIASERYPATFFEKIADGSNVSAEVVVPLLTRMLAPSSVVDVGCGTGLWLAAFQRNGVPDILGIDGDYVPRDQLAISPQQFMSHDLTKPLSLPKKFDLATCFEVAEHLPFERSRNLVETLCRLAPVVAFSAAIPAQSGASHINEQWPSFWQEHFEAMQFRCFDVIRPEIWTDARIESWYRQNMYLFVHKDEQAVISRLGSLKAPGDDTMTLISTAVFKTMLPGSRTARWYLRQFLSAAARGIKRRLKW
ncbi:hypothetical protein BH10PLA1_BH10PLA1_00700 [soil metagenome]